MNRLKIIAALLAVFVPIASHSAPMLQVNSAGQLTGATGVEVDGSDWDVVFSDGAWDFSSGTGLPATTKEEADLFSQALLDQVLLDSTLGLFDSDPETTNGCENLIECIFFTPYLVDFPNTYFSVAFNKWVEGRDDFVRDVPGKLGLTGDFGDATNWTLGVWTPSSADPGPDPGPGPDPDPDPGPGPDAGPLPVPGPTPVPEPSIIVLFAVGLFGLGFARRRKV